VHVVIMGCGRVGSKLALMLEHAGHSIAVIDQNEAAFRRLGAGFNGRKVTGVGFERDVLREAGIDGAGAFAAVSSGDNSNIIAARVARETFGVSNVVARIYDPGRAEVYQRLGIPTVATVRWTADRIFRTLLPEGAEIVWREPRAALQIAEVKADPGWIGTRLDEIEATARIRVAYLIRQGAGVIPGPDTVLQEDDLVHLVVRDADADAVEALLTSPPEES
jgi:trk system potassium uptake protein TrkA